MFRKLVLAGVLGVGLAATADARVVFPNYSPVEKAAYAEAVVVGKVTAIENDTVEAAPYSGGEKVTHKVAVIKVEKGLLGAKVTTHVKVLFIPQPHLDAKVFVQPQGRGGYQPVNLAVGHGGVFFLTRHETKTGFYQVNPALAPLDAKSDGYKAQMEAAAKAAAVLSDPAKALSAEKADDRFFAAVTLVQKYSAGPWDYRGTVEAVPVSAEESRRILKALAEVSWKADDKAAVNGYRAFAMLGLTEKDGWKEPKPEAGKDYVEQVRVAFIKWLDGPGKNYRVKKRVPKLVGK